MDNLARDVREALRLGYGVHYGHYKADHPHTADHSVEPDPPKYPPRKCKECEMEFIPTRRDQRYCTDDCKIRRSNRLGYRRRVALNMPLGPAICPVCGGGFDRYKRTQEYCSTSCAATGRNLKRREQKREKSSNQK